MRTLAITQNMTLDGVIDLTDDWFSPASGDDQLDVLEALRDQDDRADATLLGRQTFEDFRGYWPLQTDDRTGITAYLNRVTKYVVTSTLTDPAWENSVIVPGPAIEAVANLKETDGRDIVCTGSITLTHALLRAELIDELRLFVYPVVVGRGRRLIPDGVTIPTLELLENRAFRSGITLQSYRVSR
jgi:dihydrofolate reductase